MCFTVCFEECANQRFGFVEGWAFKMLIFHLVLHAVLRELGDHGFCEMQNVDISFVLYTCLSFPQGL